MEQEPSTARELPHGWERFTDWPWRQRAELAGLLAEYLHAGSQATPAKAAFITLSEDPKWEVRRAVADKLAILGEDLLVPLLAKLLNDPNRDVQRGADRVQRELRQGKARANDGGTDTSDIEHLYTQLERKIGKRAATLAREVAAKQIELVIGPVVHDLKNAMQPIISASEDMLMPPSGRALNPREEAEKVREHAQRAHRMLKALLDYARPMDLNLREEVLSDLIQRAARSSEELFANANCPVRFKTDVNTSLRVRVDRDGINRVLDNLLKNAAESFSHPRCTQTKPEVTITAREDSIEGLVRITVEDNGVGIQPEELEMLRKFRPGTRSNKPGSTGFGLANVARIVREHAGSVSIESVPGEGTTVTILLPLSDKI